VLLVMAAFALSEQAAKIQIPPGKFNVESYFVVDEKALDKYLLEENNSKTKAKESALKDLNYFLSEVNKLFATFYETRIELSVREIEFIDGMTYQTSSVKSNGMIHESTALKEFGTWLTTQNKRSSKNYDIAILFTGFNLASNTDDKTLGFAHVGAVCGETPNGIVELDATYNTVVTTAHEIAHILGANHDSHLSSYVMAPSTNPNGEDRWYFSLCSASNTWDVINNLKQNCMTTTSSSSAKPSGQVTEGLSDPHKVCARKFGTGYYFNQNKGPYDGKLPVGDEVCKRVYCGQRGGNTLSAVVTSDGMPCAIGKTCKEGTCQSDPSSAAAAAITDNDCVFGDAKYVGGAAETCDEIYTRIGTGSFCATGWLKEECCAKKKVCDEPTAFTCTPTQVKCKNENKCIPKNWLCDQWRDCKDNWDEGPESCPTKKKRSLDNIFGNDEVDLDTRLLTALRKLKNRMQEEKREQVEEVKPEGPYTIIPFEPKVDEYQELRTEMA